MKIKSKSLVIFLSFVLITAGDSNYLLKKPGGSIVQYAGYFLLLFEIWKSFLNGYKHRYNRICMKAFILIFVFLGFGLIHNVCYCINYHSIN